MVDGKVIRRTWPTASFSFTVDDLEWIDAEAKRQTEAKQRSGEYGIVTKSEVMRALVRAAKANQEANAT